MRKPATARTEGRGDQKSDLAAVARAVELFAALAHPVRLQVLDSLGRAGALSVGELCQELGVEQSAMSHQLHALREARLIRPERRGRQVYYALADQHVVSIVADALAHVQEWGVAPGFRQVPWRG